MRAPEHKKAKAAFEFLAERITPELARSIRTVLEWEQDMLGLGLEPTLLDLPADIAHAKRSNKEGIHQGLEEALLNITEPSHIQLKLDEIASHTQTQRSPDEDAG